MDYWIINSECLKKSAFYIQKTSFRVCTGGGVYIRARGYQAHTEGNRRNGEIGASQYTCEELNTTKK